MVSDPCQLMQLDESHDPSNCDLGGEELYFPPLPVLNNEHLSHHHSTHLSQSSLQPQSLPPS
jgi:hypothetical protein